MADEELKKAFMELKNKNLETAARIKAVDNQIDQLKNKGESSKSYLNMTLGCITCKRLGCVHRRSLTTRKEPKYRED